MTQPVYVVDKNETQADTMLELTIGFMMEFLQDDEVIDDNERRQEAAEVFYRLTQLRSPGQVSRMSIAKGMNS